MLASYGCIGESVMMDKLILNGLMLLFFLTDTLVNVSDYTERLKNLYWPDWNDRITSKPH